MIVDSPPVFDRSVQIGKLRTDLEVATANAEFNAVPIHAIIRELLVSIGHWREIAIERGDDLSPLTEIQ
jgi:hypothetical protein